MSILTLLILVPALAALIIALAPGGAARRIACLTALVTLLGTASLLRGLPGSDGFFEETIQQSDWLPALRIQFHVGVDAMSALMVVLTALLSIAAIVMPFKVSVGKEKLYFGSLLLLEATLIGAFSSLNLVLFYVFFEACLIPVWFLAGSFGGEKATKALMKFFLYTVVGSLVMLSSILWLGFHFQSFSYIDIQHGLVKEPLLGQLGLWLMLGFAVAFAVKTPLFPFHSWQPETYAACPTAGVVLVSGAMAKLGTYGFWRFCIVLFPEASKQAAPLMIGLAVVGILYGALVAAMQRDVKRLIAYSSISHLGYIVMGLFSGSTPAISGAILQMVNHGITVGGLFLVLGLIEEQTGTLKIRSLGGLWERTPVLSRVFLILTLASVGLPLTNGFVGEFMILLGTFQNFPAAATLATTGVIWSAVYMLWMFQRVVYGPAQKERNLTDLKGTSQLVLGVFVVLVFALGIFPKTFLDMVSPIAALAAPMENK
ncbi:MAG: NADH-quinone oxidoreductase subunit M [Armatimonadetes bacterium]|jgi:NADH-quinone oxidoreductase subunit M|nr:NADH-quinone oxidoreductase subunit M [Armatimonadota bacterium]